MLSAAGGVGRIVARVGELPGRYGSKGTCLKKACSATVVCFHCHNLTISRVLVHYQ